MGANRLRLTYNQLFTPDSANRFLKPFSALQSLNTLAVPASAAYFSVVASLEEAKQAIQQRLKVLPLGEGSNIAFAGDYDGLVIKNQISGIELLEDKPASVTIEVGGGENWHALVTHCLEMGWHGMENMALIPGTVGAAPIQNIGAYGVELSSVFESLSYLPINKFEEVAIRVLDHAACQFGYRDSVFKNALRDKALVTSIRLTLSKKPEINSSHPALLKYLQAKKLAATPKNVYTAVCAIRDGKLPNPASIPNAGSFFQNPVVSAETFEALSERFNLMPNYPMPDGNKKLAAAWLIEQVGWKGKQCDSTGMHASQALVLVNPARANGERVLEVAHQVAHSVHEQFGVQLEIEPRIYPQP